MRLSPWVSLLCITVSVGAVTNLNGTFGTFKSPNFPEIYANDLSEEWRIQVRKGYKINFKFTAFYLEDSYDADLGGACIYDYVQVTEVGQAPYRFCGKAKHHYDAPRINHWYQSKGNNITLTFVTDYSNEGISPTGFSVHYVEVDIDECADMKRLERATLDGWDELITCNHFCVNVPQTYYCDCRAGFELAPNKHTCFAKFCENQKLDALEGMIKSPEYPYQYGKLSNCQWDINVPKGFSIHLTFDALFDIEDHYEEGCVYDYLTINYKDQSDRYCGTVPPHVNRTWDLNTRDAQIQFHSDLALEKVGFRLHYNTSRIRCLKTLQAPTNGSISSSNGKGYYEFEDVVTFECDLGFDMDGHNRTECNNAGEWTHAVPQCRIISCGRPTHLTTVRYSVIQDLPNKAFKYLETVTLKCNDWYEQTVGYATWKCEHTKEWIPNPGSVSVGGQNAPICRPICGKKGSGHNRAFIPHLLTATKSEPHEWPWSVLINFGRKKLDALHRSLCSGAVISPSHILTAAHCIFESPGRLRSLEAIHVWLGVSNRTVDESEVKYAQVAKLIGHPMYNNQILNFDVAIIKLNETIVMSDTIRPICLPSTSEDFAMVKPKQSGTVAAWGLYSSDLASSNILRHSTFPIVTRQHCLAALRRKSKGGNTLSSNITENMFCAGYDDGDEGTCQGDSGAPFMMVKKTTSIYFQAGLVSFGLSVCGGAVTFSSYTKLNQEIVRWIMQSTNNLMED